MGCVFLRVGGVFLRHLQLERGRGAQPLLSSCLAHPGLLPRAAVGGRLVSAMVPSPHAPQPCQGVWGHLKPCCCHFLCHSCSREGNGQERVIGAVREGCRGNEVALGQPAALIHILACSCVAPGFPPNSLGLGGLSPFTFQGQGGSRGLCRELGAPSVPVFRCQCVTSVPLYLGGMLNTWVLFSQELSHTRTGLVPAGMDGWEHTRCPTAAFPGKAARGCCI